jgi:lipoate-protein ligase A
VNQRSPQLAVGNTAVDKAAVGTAAVDEPAVAPWSLLLDPDGLPGAVNMAADQVLLSRADRSATTTLRLYRFNPPCLSFGRNEAATKRYSRARLEQLGIDVVRRPTGGRAVWHEHEVTYAVAAPIARFGSLRQSYRAIHECLAAALRSLGADATLAPDRQTARPPVRPGSCFDTALGGEILVEGRKLVGSAQVRHGSAFLQHGSILLDIGRNDLADFGTATSLSAVLGRTVTFTEVANAIIAAWDGRLASGGSTASTAIADLSALTAQFHSPLWT